MYSCAACSQRQRGGSAGLEHMAHERPSLSHLADKFNTEAPPGYVAGRGRGASGFSRPPPEPPRGRGRRGGAGPSSEGGGEEGEEGGDAANGAESGGFDADGKLSGDAGDTRDLDLGGTERFEVERTSMSQAEAGYAIEPFNMKQERAEGHFDDDFNYVWKRRGDEADETNDAWLGEATSEITRDRPRPPEPLAPPSSTAPHTLATHTLATPRQGRCRLASHPPRLAKRCLALPSRLPSLPPSLLPSMVRCGGGAAERQPPPPLPHGTRTHPPYPTVPEPTLPYPTVPEPTLSPSARWTSPRRRTRRLRSGKHASRGRCGEISGDMGLHSAPRRKLIAAQIEQIGTQDEVRGMGRGETAPHTAGDRPTGGQLSG